jgi:hypothetical protein
MNELRAANKSQSGQRRGCTEKRIVMTGFLTMPINFRTNDPDRTDKKGRPVEAALLHRCVVMPAGSIPKAAAGLAAGTHFPDNAAAVRATRDNGLYVAYAMMHGDADHRGAGGFKSSACNRQSRGRRGERSQPEHGGGGKTQSSRFHKRYPSIGVDSQKFDPLPVA